MKRKYYIPASARLSTARAKINAEDMAKEQTAVRAATEEAKVFRAKLEAVGISYTSLLELEDLRGDMGDIAHNILLGWERGECWPNG